MYYAQEGHEMCTAPTVTTKQEFIYHLSCKKKNSLPDTRLLQSPLHTFAFISNFSLLN